MENTDQHKKHQQHTPKILFKLQPITILWLILFVILCGVGFLYNFHQGLLKKPVPEVEQNEMKTIPADVKKTIKIQGQIASPSATLHIPILMYHYVEYVRDKRDTIRQSLDVTPNIFEQQIQTLIAAHYTFLTAKDLGDILNGKVPIPTNPILLTFDDGHWDLDTDVLPILKKYHVYATAYVVPGFVGTNSDSLTPEQLQDVIKSGLIEVGAHTVHHLSLKGKPLPLVQFEIMQSKAMLENTYHIHVFSFAYPYGSFDQQAVQVVQQAGFLTAVSTIAGNEQSNQNKFFLFRIRPGSFTGQALLNYINREWKPYKAAE